MARSTVLLDLTISDLEGKNWDRINFNISSLHKIECSTGKYLQMTFILRNKTF